MSRGSLVAVYLFGSFARDEGDDVSDVDLLAIVEDGQGTVPDHCVLDCVPAGLNGREPSISWYGKGRIRQMFEGGELFAWHLHQEAKFLQGRENLISMLGEPSAYASAADDVFSFKEIAAGVREELLNQPQNALYELGLVYVCLRNASMAASAVLCGQPDFSRRSPYHLGSEVSACPLLAEEYDIAMRARMAGQRGIEPPQVTLAYANSVADRAFEWLGVLTQKVRQANG